MQKSPVRYKCWLKLCIWVLYIQLPFSLLHNLPFPLNFPGRCFNTYKSSNSHKSFFYSFLFRCFLPATRFHKTGRGHNSCKTFCSSLWFGSNQSSVIREGTCTSKIPSFMPHFLRKADYKHSNPSLPLQDKTQSNNTQSSRPQSITVQLFPWAGFFSSALSRMESYSQTSPFSATQRHKCSQDFSTGCISMAVLLIPTSLL